MRPPSRKHRSVLIQFFLATQHDRITPSDPLWNQPIPQNRPDCAAQNAKGAADAVHYGEYFEAVRAFLTAEEFKALVLAVNQKASDSITSNQIKRIHVFLSKHGAFYHPARITLRTAQRQYHFVLNVALSLSGQDQISTEFDALQRLSQAYPFEFVPQVFYLGSGSTSGGRKWPMFLGEWLEGFHEFHHVTSGTKTANPTQVVVWDPEAGNVVLSTDQTAHLYRQAAMIPASFFNPETFQVVFPWHHAAGDFVVRIRRQKIEVKLITVRSYVPLMAVHHEAEDITPRAAEVMHALVHFLTQLSIRMRLDRLGGVGEISWLDQQFVAPIVKGFFQGLDLMRRLYAIPHDFMAVLRHYLKHQPESAWGESAAAHLQTYLDDAPELPIIRRNLAAHINRLRTVLQG